MAIHTDSTSRITPFSRAPNTSARWKPNVRRSFAGRAATMLAISAMTRAAASVSMWTASASSASEPDQIAPRICTTMTVLVIASEAASSRRLLAERIPPALDAWSCMTPGYACSCAGGPAIRAVGNETDSR